MHDGKANTGPLDFFFLLQRRKVSFDRYCENEGISSREDFLKKIAEIERSGEFFVSEEMKQVGLGRFPEPHQDPGPQSWTEMPFTPSESSPEPLEGQEEAPSRKKRTRIV